MHLHCDRQCWLRLSLFLIEEKQQTEAQINRWKSWQTVMTLFRRYCLRSITKIQRFLAEISPLDAQFLCHHHICLPCFFSHWHRAKVGSQEVSLPPPSLPPRFPVAGNNGPAFSSTLCGKMLGPWPREGDSRKREKKNKKKKRREEGAKKGMRQQEREGENVGQPG